MPITLDNIASLAKGTRMTETAENTLPLVTRHNKHGRGRQEQQWY